MAARQASRILRHCGEGLSRSHRVAKGQLHAAHRGQAGVGRPGPEEASEAPASVLPQDEERALDDSVEGEPAARRSALGAIGWTPLVLLAGAVLLIAVAGLSASTGWNLRQPLPDKPSIAVLPFENIGRDARWQRFAEGLTEDIITDLSL